MECPFVVDWSEFRAFCKDCSVGCFALLEGEALGMSEQELGVSSGVQLRSGQSFLCVFFFPFFSGLRQQRCWLQETVVLKTNQSSLTNEPPPVVHTIEMDPSSSLDVNRFRVVGDVVKALQYWMVTPKISHF